jgi:DNA anti-recombination protein RmuC
LKAITEGQLKQFEMGRTQIATFVDQSKAQLNKEKTSIYSLNEISQEFDQDIQNLQKKFTNKLKNVFHSTISTIDKQVNNV